MLVGDGRTSPAHFDPAVLGAFREIHHEIEAIYRELPDETRTEDRRL